MQKEIIDAEQKKSSVSAEQSAFNIAVNRKEHDL